MRELLVLGRAKAVQIQNNFNAELQSDGFVCSFFFWKANFAFSENFFLSVATF